MLHEWFQAFRIGRQVPPVVGSEGAGLVGHEGALMRMHLVNEFEQSVKGIAFDVEFARGPVA